MVSYTQTIIWLIKIFGIDFDSRLFMNECSFWTIYIIFIHMKSSSFVKVWLGLWLTALCFSSLHVLHANNCWTTTKDMSSYAKKNILSVETRATKLKNSFNRTSSSRTRARIIREFEHITKRVFPNSSITSIAVDNANFTTLVTALKAADLVTTLEWNGPFTVFAPTNAAFSKIDTKLIQDLLKPENKAKLSNILTYHVVPWNLRSTDLKDGMELTTVQWSKLKVSLSNGIVKIWWSTVTTADVEARNGYIHIIDSVLLP